MDVRITQDTGLGEYLLLLCLVSFAEAGRALECLNAALPLSASLLSLVGSGSE